MSENHEIANNQIKVLIAEDETDIRETIADILKDEGFQVFEAKNGKAGYEIFADKNPHVIVSDIMMPEVDGYGFLKLVRETKSKSNMIPFLFLSALGQKENVIKGMNLSASDYLVKPIDFEILIAKVREKALNYIKTDQVHEKGITNIKKQISTTLSDQMNHYIKSLIHGLKVLKEEPYGPLPHRRYLEDLSKLYSDATRLQACVINSLDEKVIDNRLKAEEEIFCLENFLENAIKNFPEKIKEKIAFNKPYEGENLPKVKLEKAALINIVKRIIAGASKAGPDYHITISLIIDNLGQMVMIFYIDMDKDLDLISKFINKDKIEEIALSQSLYFKEMTHDDRLNYLLTIPSFRMINS